jgi:hypothetical protein
MPEDSYKALLGSLRSAPPSFAALREIVAWVSPGIKSASEGDVSKIIESLASLSRVRGSKGVEVAILSHDASVAALESITGLSTAAAQNLEVRLNEVLLLGSLLVTADKAKELQVQRERNFCDARILTDLRPVFGSDATSAPTAITVIHTLKIGYHDSGSPDHREFYVAIDGADIKSLKASLERAEQKEQSLKSMLNSANINSVDLP